MGRLERSLVFFLLVAGARRTFLSNERLKGVKSQVPAIGGSLPGGLPSTGGLTLVDESAPGLPDELDVIEITKTIRKGEGGRRWRKNKVSKNSGKILCAREMFLFRFSSQGAGVVSSWQKLLSRLRSEEMLPLAATLRRIKVLINKRNGWIDARIGECGW